MKTRKRRDVSEGRRAEWGSNQKKQKNPESGTEMADTLPIVARPQKSLVSSLGCWGDMPRQY